MTARISATRPHVPAPRGGVAVPPRVALTDRDRITLELARHGGDMVLGAVLRLAGPPPGPRELVDHLAARIGRVPELTYRPYGLTGRRPYWARDPDFDVARHVYEEVRPARPGRAADADLAAVLGRPLPEDRPLWGVWLVRSREPGAEGYALCYRVHHAFQDGLAAMAAVEALFGPAPGAAPVPFGDADPGGAAAPPLAEPEPVPGCLVTVRVDTAELFRTARAAGASLHQLCLALATATARQWAPLAGTAPLRANLGISLRRPATPVRPIGNQVGVLSVELPVDERDPLLRLRRLVRGVPGDRLVGRGRRAHRLRARWPVLDRLALRRAIDPRTAALSVADVRLRRVLEFAGTPVRQAYPIPVLVPGQRLFIAWTSYRGQLHVTFRTDRPTPGLDQLPRLWRSALDDLCRALDD
ncbi:wax ester/triacylglycerol synthase domain-containing protein [Streptomyces showdoensis]|uniref:wax ester/triacylglycerol synthase domain-containing protein n=1 Tax=Streptomyces showdoensis TaxID=68268 RepID=UPI000F4E3351|nr:wax ester/triacylglycerol synthase domain-containing protein [Streptomyces showdoensis]